VVANIRACKAFLLFSLMVLAGAALSQKTTRVIVVDSATVEPLPAVFVRIKSSNRSVLADPSGIFTITTKRADTLILTHVGYKDVIVPLFFEEDAILIRMGEKITLLNEVTISSRRLYPNELNPRKSAPPRTVTLPGSLASPWEYFNKKEKEKRKLTLLMQENNRIRTFIEVVTDPSMKAELMNEHAVSETTYYDILVKFNQQKFPVIYSNDADAIIESLHDFFSKNNN